MPMLFARRKPDHIARTDFLNGATLTLRTPASERDDKSLPKRMSMPCRAGPRLEGDNLRMSPASKREPEKADRCGRFR